MLSGTNRRVIIGMVFLVSFVVFAYNMFPLLGLAKTAPECTLAGECVHEKEAENLKAAFPLVVSLALVVGAGTYYLMSGKVEEKEETLKSKEESLKKNTDVLLKFLSEDEKKLVNLLMENNGKVLQAEVTRLPGMTKVKSHRVVLRLMDKGVLEKETLGKTNILKFPKEIKEGLL